MENDLFDIRCEFLQLLTRSEKGAILAILAILYSSMGYSPVEPITEHTAADCHKALTVLDRLNAGDRKYAAYYGPAVAFIRREWLHEEAADHA